MIVISADCSKCNRLEELIIDISKGEQNLVTEFICDVCKANTREKLINSLTKKWWEFWK